MFRIINGNLVERIKQERQRLGEKSEARKILRSYEKDTREGLAIYYDYSRLIPSRVIDAQLCLTVPGYRLNLQ
ncbi:hypothetical protein COU60_01005 [Candidatus Pacearchaeota archaeon CG10_big_fil_rev_8_21_14_0_10_34_76]|nr:MAG: hypothetical protein COU60_01005 [Candidatus Pacearchaeota archaeon CG10_big_fil_rev_8_21_14_0_10_34_76]